MYSTRYYNPKNCNPREIPANHTSKNSKTFTNTHALSLHTSIISILLQEYKLHIFSDNVDKSRDMWITFTRQKRFIAFLFVCGSTMSPRILCERGNAIKLQFAKRDAKRKHCFCSTISKLWTHPCMIHHYLVLNENHA